MFGDNRWFGRLVRYMGFGRLKRVYEVKENDNGGQIWFEIKQWLWVSTNDH